MSELSLTLRHRRTTAGYQAEARALAKIEESVSGDLLQDADRPRMLRRRGFYCFCPCFLACIFAHQLSQLMFDGDSRRKLELSSEMMRAHWLLLS
jgi:ubiquitin C-terminal hydrolase